MSDWMPVHTLNAHNDPAKQVGPGPSHLDSNVQLVSFPQILGHSKLAPVTE
jgi:hypothetical protein